MRSVNKNTVMFFVLLIVQLFMICQRAKWQPVRSENQATLEVLRETTKATAEEKHPWLQRHIEQARERARQRAMNGAPEYYKGLDEVHPAVEDLKPSEELVHSIADLNIVGAPKAGTSQLYRILAGHRDAQAWHEKMKEHCFSRRLRLKSMKPNQIRDKLLQFHQSELQRHINTTAKTVNGCHWFDDIELSWRYVQPSNARYIYIMRDPAEWLWAAWNFWQQQGMDSKYRDELWAKENTHYRSPELFHELVASGDKTLGGNALLERLDQLTRNAVRLKHMMGDKALILKGEDMTPDLVKDAVLPRLSEFTGLDSSAFDPDTYGTITNCNQNKGINTSCSKKSGAYPIAGGRDLLPETRTIIYMRYWEECKLWAREFGVEYPSCLHVMDE